MLLLWEDHDLLALVELNLSEVPTWNDITEHFTHNRGGNVIVKLFAEFLHLKTLERMEILEDYLYCSTSFKSMRVHSFELYLLFLYLVCFLHDNLLLLIE